MKDSPRLGTLYIYDTPASKALKALIKHHKLNIIEKRFTLMTNLTYQVWRAPILVTPTQTLKSHFTIAKYLNHYTDTSTLFPAQHETTIQKLCELGDSMLEKFGDAWYEVLRRYLIHPPKILYETPQRSTKWFDDVRSAIWRSRSSGIRYLTGGLTYADLYISAVVLSIDIQNAYPDIVAWAKAVRWTHS